MQHTCIPQHAAAKSGKSTSTGDEKPYSGNSKTSTGRRTPH